MHATDIKSVMDTEERGGVWEREEREERVSSVKSGPSICFNNSVKEDYFLGLLLRAIKQGDGNPSFENGNDSR